MTVIEHPSPNKSLRKSVAVDTVVVHATAGEMKPSLDWLCNPKSGVSSHFLIDRDGTIFRLVPESMKAWHAGSRTSTWNGRQAVNEFSIGIELVNLNDGLDPYPELQIASLAILILGLMKDWPIKVENIIGHFNVDPRRKTDPGILFPWVKLGIYLETLR